jgi:hypothetical protein
MYLAYKTEGKWILSQSTSRAILEHTLSLSIQHTMKISLNSLALGLLYLPRAIAWGGKSMVHCGECRDDDKTVMIS